MNQPGQITPDSPFGKALMKVAADHKTFLDVGTWNGAGTTLCLVKAVAHRPGVKIYSLETNFTLLNIAKEFWKPCPPALDLIWGKLSHHMMQAGQIRTHPKFAAIEEHFNLHYRQDCIDAARAPIISLPCAIDMAILDGGEFSGQGDFEAVIGLNPKVIALDDISTMKNDVAYHTLATSPRWQILAQGMDRNGWAIFKRVSEPAYTSYCETEILK